MFNVRFFKFEKRENSTKQPDISGGLLLSVILKENTSLNNPAFLIEFQRQDGTADPNAWPDYNYCYVEPWQKYFFVDDWTNEGNLWRAACSIDVLATYKAAILASTQFVSYSSVLGDAWLADTRIPVLKDTVVGSSSVAMPFFVQGGIYILSCIGKSGSCLYALGLNQLKALIASISGADDYFLSDAENRARTIMQGGANPLSAEDMLGFATLATQNDMLGNAYGNAPNCLRSCIFVPFSSTPFEVGRDKIFLGNYDTGITNAIIVKAEPATGSVSVNIPWHYSDWRRGYCEQVYLYIPLVGMVGLSSDNLTHTDSITVYYSYTCTDGTIAYQVTAGGEVIGSYGGSCAVNYPLGVNQQASAGQVMQSVISGISQTVSAGITGNIVGAAAGAVGTAYNAISTALTSHPSSIGGIGGGAGSGLSRNLTCYTVAHNTNVEPADMAATMGRPTMKPLQLSSCSGYCQCANAHVEANASLEELDAIATMLNSGFYIE